MFKVRWDVRPRYRAKVNWLDKGDEGREVEWYHERKLPHLYKLVLYACRDEGVFYIYLYKTVKREA